jgi:GT2 family glycosyltransferase
MTGGLLFICPQYGAFGYSRRAILSFFRYTPETLSPRCLVVDDASPGYDAEDWQAWGQGMPGGEKLVTVRRQENRGLTASWNEGLRFAREHRLRYAICGNSDIFFTPGWHEGLCHHLDRDAHLVGPLTNAPGLTPDAPKQQVARYLWLYRVDDDPAYLAKVAARLRRKAPLERFIPALINGFFLMSTTEKWWDGTFDAEHVFDPANRMVRNEVELQRRWMAQAKKVGIVPSSFIFHYRGVSRGRQVRDSGWCELGDPQKPV